MNRISTVCASAAALALIAVQPAQAGNGGAVAAGVIGGLAVGAIVGSAAANSARGPYDGPVYAPAYGAPPPACVAQERVWSNRYQAYVVRNVRVPCY